jgi:hypothetical protein
MEISSKEGIGFTELFDEVLKIGFQYQATTIVSKPKKNCYLL